MRRKRGEICGNIPLFILEEEFLPQIPAGVMHPADNSGSLVGEPLNTWERRHASHQVETLSLIMLMSL